MQWDTKQSERGMVSILVTMIMMIVISLIIIGISQVTRSNQREQLDQQLSTQAYYAAESGLNQAAKFFASHPTAIIDTATSGNCTQFITNPATTGLNQTLDSSNRYVLDANTNVSYTCLMVNSTPATLQKAPLTQDSNTVWHLQDAGGNNFTKLDFKWSPDGSSQFSGATNTCTAAAGTNNFTAYGNWKCAYGILRIDLVATPGTISTTPGTGNGLEGIARTLYLVPTFSGTGVNTATQTTNSGQPGLIIYVKCTMPNPCDLNLSLNVASPEYYARLSMIYQDSDSATLAGTDISGPATFAGGQAVIDVTGKAQDELRRVQARIPLTISGAAMPNFALQTTDRLCKQLGVAPAPVNTTDGCPP